MTPDTEEKNYILTYSQPQVASRNPVTFDWETNYHEFKAKDDNDAYKKACRFLGSEPVTCDKITKHRNGKRLTQENPYRFVREFVSPSEIKSLAS